MIDQLEVVYRAEGNAGGIVCAFCAAGALRILWTAMRGHAGAWFVTLHRRVQPVDNDLCARLINEIAARIASLPRTV